MKIYYIVSNDGLLKRYFAGESQSEESTNQPVAEYSVTLKKAKIFNTIEEARLMISNMSLKNCVIIDQFGTHQQ